MFVKPEFILLARGQAQKVRVQGRTWASKSKPEMVENPSELSLTLHQASIPKPADIFFLGKLFSRREPLCKCLDCSGSAGPSSLELMWISTQSGTKNDVSLCACPQSSSVQEDNLQISLMYASGTGSSQKQLCLFPLEGVFLWYSTVDKTFIWEVEGLSSGPVLCRSDICCHIDVWVHQYSPETSFKAPSLSFVSLVRLSVQECSH